MAKRGRPRKQQPPQIPEKTPPVVSAPELSVKRDVSTPSASNPPNGSSLGVNQISGIGYLSAAVATGPIVVERSVPR